MKFIKFNYTDSKGKESQRQLLVTENPSDKISGFDVSELSDQEIGMLANKHNQILEKFMIDLEELKSEFDIKHNFRQFQPERMVELEKEWL